MLRAGYRLLNRALFQRKLIATIYTLTPRPPPSLKDPRPRISIDLGRYAFANTCIYRIAGFFRGRKLSRISRFCGDLRKFSPRKSIFKQLDTALVGVVHWVTANSRVFFAKMYFQAIRESFLPRKTPAIRYICACAMCSAAFN